MTKKNIFLSSALMGLLSSSALMAQNTWIKYPAPVINRSAIFPDWKGLATADAFVMNDNDTLKMWYSGSGWLTASDDCPHVRMGYAWSLDGINWNEYSGNPVLDINSDTSKFDSDGIETPTVVKDLTAPAGQRYKLWYAGRKARCQPVNDHKLGYAYSPDGIHWTKYAGNPVFVPGNSADWYNNFITGPSVILESGVYKMWFTAPDLVINGQSTDGKGNIGYATSTDGINWVVYPSPVLVAGAQSNQDSASIAEPSVVKIENTYYMVYSALDKWAVENFQVGYAGSGDGIHWTKAIQNPVLKIGTAGQWDRFWASHPTMIYDSTLNKFKMWYTGRDTANIVSLSGYYWDIGYAQSSFFPFINGINNESMMIYPNPARNKLNIKLPYDLNGAAIKIYNQSGQIEKSLSNFNGRIISIETFDLLNGIHFIVVQNKIRRLHGKFIIAK